MSFPHAKGLTENARSLRKSATPWERKLWYEFLSAYPTRFQRQKPIGAYIADFYCARVKLVIELDGGQHYEETRKVIDEARTAAQEQYGVHVLRFSNLEVTENFPGVCQRIDETVKEMENI